MRIGLTLSEQEVLYLDSIFLKSYNTTINNLITDFRTGAKSYTVPFGAVFGKGVKKIICTLKADNAVYLDSINIINKSHTIRMLIYVAANQ